MVPIVLSSPEKMLKIRSAVLKDKSDETLDILQKAGVIHIEESAELDTSDKEAIENKRRQITDLLERLDRVMSFLPQGTKVTLESGIEEIFSVPFEEIKSEIMDFTSVFDYSFERNVEIMMKLESLRRVHKSLTPFVDRVEYKVQELNYKGRFLFSRIFLISADGFQNLKDQLPDYTIDYSAGNIEEEVAVLTVGYVENLSALEVLVKELGGETVDFPAKNNAALPEYLGSVDGEIRDLEKERDDIHARVEEKVKEKLERLVLLREALVVENEGLMVLEKASQSRYVTLIEGWIPEADLENTTALLKGSIGSVFVDYRKPESSEEPPTKMKNPKIMKPFQVLVNLYGIPQYREWDPTPIISYSFALFFGIMAADVIYAIGIIILGKLLLPKFVDDPTTESFKLFQRLVYLSGGAALVFGLLTGQWMGDFPRFLGIENLALSGFVQGILGDPIMFIVASLVLGLIHVNIAFLLSFIKGIKSRDKAAIVSKIGMFTLQAGIPPILSGVLKVDMPFLTADMSQILLYVMFAGIVLVIASVVMQRGGLGLMLGIFDVIGLLGDVMSYARLAGVGMATFYLAFCFNLMSDVFRGIFTGLLPDIVGVVVGIIVGILILLFGHVLNVLLAGLGAFVHSLRLCFVEFMFKFYEGGGREYSPFRVHKRTVFVGGDKTRGVTD
jgi:V/A-type H+/Na+-transporting ATPase subunit I